VVPRLIRPYRSKRFVCCGKVYLATRLAVNIYLKCQCAI
jgi:hypothetical protein